MICVGISLKPRFFHLFALIVLPEFGQRLDHPRRELDQPESHVGVVPHIGGLTDVHFDAVGFILIAFGMMSGLCFAVVSSTSLHEGILKLLSGRIKSRFGKE